MIFEGRLLSEITNEEFKQLVNDHIAEKQHIEFKVTIDHKTDEDRYETLCDITSLANAGGGYIVIGIRDDGKGRAQKFESLDDPDRIIKSLQSLCLDYVSERIEALEIESREIDTNKIVIIRVPSSTRKPHMVTYKNKTHFVTRYNDGKREMTIGEIRLAFTEDLVSRRLYHIEDGLKTMMNNQRKEDRHQIIELLEKGTISGLDVEDGYAISKGILGNFKNTIGQDPYFRICVTPISTNRNLVDVDSKQIRDLIQYPPNQRNAGWNMEDSYSVGTRFVDGITRGSLDDKKLTLLQNGHMEFAIKLDYGFSWNQPESEYKKNPLLYPYPVVEYPVTFLRLYRQLADIIKLESEFVISMQYFNIKGYILRPYAPESLYFKIPRVSPKLFTKENFISPSLEIPNDFNPDKSVYELIKTLYASFGYTSDMIPFYKPEEEKFVID